MTAGRYVAVIGSGTTTGPDLVIARDVGALLADAGATVVCGGLGGVMAAACQGAAQAGGVTVGILPGTDRDEANAWVGVRIATGLGELRNGLVVRTADVVIAIGGEYGTLSEIALALKASKPVVAVGSWGLVHPDGLPENAILRASSAIEAAGMALALAGG
jgi:uncharacterized protein (TIGR00725 family)